MVLQRDTSTVGTVIGIAIAIVAVGGSVLFGWEWNAFPTQPIPLVIGVVAALAAVTVMIRQLTT